MFGKNEIISSLKSQGLVNDPESWIKFAAFVACVNESSETGLAKAVLKCYDKYK